MYCPVCQQEHALSFFETYISQLKRMHHQKMLWWWTIYDHTLDYILKVFTQEKAFSDTHMACDPCFTSQHALVADPAKQKYVDFAPYLAYHDEKRLCKTCEQNFVFTKHEQLTWYEHHRFWSRIRPVHCLSCRQLRREQSRVNRDLSLLLKHGEPTQIETCQKVAELYIEMEKPEKAARYFNRAKKLKQKLGQKLFSGQEPS